MTGTEGGEVLIRRATPEDAAALAALLNPIIAARIYSAMDSPETPQSLRAWIEGFSARGIFHVAVEQPSGRVVGMQEMGPFLEGAGAFAHVGVIGTFVDLTRHRRGIGARLFAATYEAARKLGYEKILAYVRADNVAGLRAYRGQGFRDIGTSARHAKIDGRYIDEILLEKFL